jgi:hypothetical protein
VTRVVLRFPHALVERLDELTVALELRPSATEARRPSRASAVRALISVMLDAWDGLPVADTARAFDRLRPHGRAMRRVVLRLPRAMVERIGRLQVALRAQWPAERWSRALVVRGLLVASLASTTEQRSAPSPAGPDTDGEAQPAEA